MANHILHLRSRCRHRAGPLNRLQDQWRSSVFGCLVAAVMLLMAAGCTPNEPRLTFWVGGAPQEVEYWEELVDQFEINTGIEVEMIRQPAATEQRKQGLVIALASGLPNPDVFLMDIIWISQFVQSDWLKPLDPYFKEELLHPRLFFSSVVEEVDRHGSRYYALPVFVDVGVLYYRKDLLHRHGFEQPPATWQELLRQALTVQKAERRHNESFNGFVWQGAQYEGLVCTFLEFIATHGGGISGDDGAVLLARNANIEGLQFMQDLIQRYRISPPNTYTEMKEEEVRRSFQRGDALFERNWLYAWSLHQQPDSPVGGRIGLTSLPHTSGAQSAATLGGWHVGISKNTDDTERAWRLVEYLLSRDVQKKLQVNLGWYSGRKDIYMDPEVRRAVADVDRLQQIVSHSVGRPDLAYYDQVSQIIQRYVNDCLSGQGRVRQAVAAMQQEIERVEELYGHR